MALTATATHVVRKVRLSLRSSLGGPDSSDDGGSTHLSLDVVNPGRSQNSTNSSCPCFGSGL